MNALSGLVRLAICTTGIAKGLVTAYPNVLAIIHASDTLSAGKKLDAGILIYGLLAPVAFATAGISVCFSNKAYVALGCGAVIMQGYFLELIDHI